MKPQLTDEKIEKAEKNMRLWAKGIISGKYTRDGKFHRKEGTKTLMIGYRNMRQFLMIINDLIYYKSQVEEMQKTLEWYADVDNTTDEMINDSGFRARQTLESLKEDKPNDHKPML